MLLPVCPFDQIIPEPVAVRVTVAPLQSSVVLPAVIVGADGVALVVTAITFEADDVPQLLEAVAV
jgi:hypothetical protein